MGWQPSASLKNLQLRADILKKIREFFEKRQILEVETPLLCRTSVTDPHIESITANYHTAHYYLQTSPEYAMKRLLAAGSGAIYQICKAFRADESGQIHNPEFTMLEWYRPEFDHHDLMNEVDELLQLVLHVELAERLSYQQLFESYYQFNPHTVSIAELKMFVKNHIDLHSSTDDKDTLLHLLLTHCIEPHLGKNNRPTFIYDFPVSQAALARIQSGHPAVASRFEVYVDGIELANGFHELQNVHEQRLRFEKNLLAREHLSLPFIEIDEYFLAALEHGLPDCAGVALGLDRLIMLAAKCQRIADVISFDFSRI